jgi:hypothetical protein
MSNDFKLEPAADLNNNQTVITAAQSLIEEARVASLNWEFDKSTALLTEANGLLDISDAQVDSFLGRIEDGLFDDTSELN